MPEKQKGDLKSILSDLVEGASKSEGKGLPHITPEGNPVSVHHLGG